MDNIYCTRSKKKQFKKVSPQENKIEKCFFNFVTTIGVLAIILLIYCTIDCITKEMNGIKKCQLF